MYEIVRTFTPIFRSLTLEYPRAASLYYVNLIINFPTNFQNILNEAQTIYGSEIHRQALLAGRQELLQKGIIAEIYFTEGADIDFDREMYLPVNPEMIWDENLETANTCWTESEEIAFRKSKVINLYNYFLKNFKRYGLGTEKGSVSGLFNISWMWRHGFNIYNHNNTKNVDAILNSLDSFMVPDTQEYHEKLLEGGLKERIIFDLISQRRVLKDEELMLKECKPAIDQRINKLTNVYKDYREQIDVRYLPVNYTTTRLAICYNESGPFLACDFRKVLSLDPKRHPYYMGTFYLQNELINHIKENFEAAWANSIVLNEIY